jgi:hypothetical protein
VVIETISGRDADQWASVRKIAPARFDAIASYEMEFGRTIKRSLTVADSGNQAEFHLTGVPMDS